MQHSIFVHELCTRNIRLVSAIILTKNRGLICDTERPPSGKSVAVLLDLTESQLTIAPL